MLHYKIFKILLCMHSIFFYICNMLKETTIDHALRATWQAVSKMYNEQAAKHDSTMATAFVLLNIDYENGTPSTCTWTSNGNGTNQSFKNIKNNGRKRCYL